MKNDRIIRSTDCLAEFGSIEQLITVSYVVVFHTLMVNDTCAIVKTSVNDTILMKYLKIHRIFRKFFFHNRN